MLKESSPRLALFKTFLISTPAFRDPESKVRNASSAQVEAQRFFYTCLIIHCIRCSFLPSARPEKTFTVADLGWS